MDPICLSAAAVLRCTSLTKGQNLAFIVPVALEFLTSCLLTFLKWGSGSKQHLFLVAEGWIYFILALIELSVNPLLSEDNLQRFRLFDIGIGIASFLPLLLYTLYLYLFTRRELLTTLPKYLVDVAKVTMFLSLPVIIATNEVASVSGITITFNSATNLPSLTFSSKHDEWMWLFFTSLTFAMLMAYQATVFCFSFFRLVWLLVKRYRGEHDIRVGGIAWVSAGVKLGALEAILGFAGGTFEVSMTRRVLRFMGRACLCIGLILGVDPVTEAIQRPYEDLEKPKILIARSRRQPQISDPRFSTFEQLSPMAAGFHSALRNPDVSQMLQTPCPTIASLKTPHYLTFTQRQLLTKSEGSDLHGLPRGPSLMDTAGQHVTVLYDIQGGPPLLQMRFSALGVPTVCPNAQARQHLVEPTRVSSESPPSFDDALPLPKPSFAQGQKSRHSAASSSSFTPSTIEIIDVPRRTVSQRRAQARVILARTGDQVEKQESKGNGTLDAEIFESDSADRRSGYRPNRPPTPGPFGSLSRSSHDGTPGGAHGHTATQSVSVKSVADSLQAVQDLAGQFPPLPPSASFVHSVDSAYEGRTGTSNHVVHAIGSPTDLEAVRGLPASPSRVSQDETVNLPEAASLNQAYEEDIALASQQEYERCQTPSSSSHSGFSIVTIKQTEQTPQNPETQGDNTVNYSPLSFTNPKPPIDEVLTRSTAYLSTGKVSVGPSLKPIAIPHRRSNLPEVIQCWDDGIP